VDKEPSVTREAYGGALRENKSDSPFTQPPLKAVQLYLQEAEKQHRHAGCGYDGGVVRIEGKLEVVRGWEDFVDIQPEENRGDQSSLC